MSGGDYMTILAVVLFLACAMAGNRLFKVLRLPSILGEILVGVVLGPNVLDLVPFSCHPVEVLAATPATVHDDALSNITSNITHHSPMLLSAAAEGGADVAHCTNIWTFAGTLGVGLMIFESGMHIDFDKVKKVGAKALLVAVIGTLLPIFSGMFMAGYAFGMDLYPDGLAAGISLAPTSVGISLKMLNDVKQQSTMYGQTIITAAFIDDIFSLVALVILLNMAGGSVTAGSIILPFVLSFAFVGWGCVTAKYVMPHFKEAILSRIPEYPMLRTQPRDELHLAVMMTMLILYGWIGSILGSHLLGAFVAGISFTDVPRSRNVWRRQMKRIVNWMMRMFFAATVAFSIPISIMLNWDALWKGVLLGIGPCIAAKIASGLHLGAERWIIGWAMVARGEFAYLVAQLSIMTPLVDTEDGAPPRYLMSMDTYAVVIWALIMSTIVAPIAFKFVLTRYSLTHRPRRAYQIGGLGRQENSEAGLAQENSNSAASNGTDSDASDDERVDDADGGDRTISQKRQRKKRNKMHKSHASVKTESAFTGMFIVRVVGQHFAGFLHEVCQTLHENDLDLRSATADTDGITDSDMFVVMPRGKEKNINEDKLIELKHELLQVLNDKHAQVVFEPIEDLENAVDKVLEIQLIGEHHPDILHEVTDLLAERGMDVTRAIIDEHDAGNGEFTDVDIFYAVDRNRTESVVRRSSQFDPLYGTEFMKGGDAGAAGGGGGLLGPPALYPRPSSQRCISAKPKQRLTLKDELKALYDSHGLKGEVMVKLVHSDQVRSTHAIHVNEKQAKLLCVRVRAFHHPDILHEVCDKFHLHNLDVVAAEIFHESDTRTDMAIFYCKCKDDLDMQRQRRLELRAEIIQLLKSHAGADETRLFGIGVSVRACKGGEVKMGDEVQDESPTAFAAPTPKMTPRTMILDETTGIDGEGFDDLDLATQSTQDLANNISGPAAAAAAADGNGNGRPLEVIVGPPAEGRSILHPGHPSPYKGPIIINTATSPRQGPGIMESLDILDVRSLIDSHLDTRGESGAPTAEAAAIAAAAAAFVSPISPLGARLEGDGFTFEPNTNASLAPPQMFSPESPNVNFEAGTHILHPVRHSDQSPGPPVRLHVHGRSLNSHPSPRKGSATRQGPATPKLGSKRNSFDELILRVDSI